MLPNFNDTVTNNSIYLGIAGFSKLELRLITSLCNLSKKRNTENTEHRSIFDITPIGSGVSIDIYVVDADREDSSGIRSLVNMYDPNASILWITTARQEGSKSGEFWLSRNRLGGQLIHVLDDIVASSSVKDETSNLSYPDSKTCLVVDDSELIRTQMELILREFQLAIDFAEDAEKALRLVWDKSYDIIFLDVVLPEMNGYKACKLIKSNPHTKDIPVVMLTSKTMLFNKMHGSIVGCDVYLTKPTNGDEVSKVLKQLSIIEK